MSIVRHLRSNKSLPVIAVCMLLFAQAAPVLWRMDCLTSGRTVLSWGHARSCMPDQEKGSGSELANQCCKYMHVGGERSEYVKASEPAPHQQIAVPFDVPPVLLPLHAFTERTIAWARPPPGRAEDRSILFRRLLI